MEEQVVNGVGRLFTSDNIAIVTLTLMCIGEGVLISYLLKGLLSMKDVLKELEKVIVILNERLSHNEDK